MWIERAYKNEYSDSKKRGLRLVFRSGTDKQFRLHILSFAKWLRKRYWFPIRVEIRFLHSEEIGTMYRHRIRRARSYILRQENCADNCKDTGGRKHYTITCFRSCMN